MSTVPPDPWNSPGSPAGPPPGQHPPAPQPPPHPQGPPPGPGAPPPYVPGPAAVPPPASVPPPQGPPQGAPLGAPLGAPQGPPQGPPPYGGPPGPGGPGGPGPGPTPPRTSAGWPGSAKIAVAILAVTTLAAGAAAAVGFSQGSGDSSTEIDQLEAELEDTESDAKKRADDLETTATSLQTELETAQSDLEAINGLFPITSDDVLGADPSGTWSMTATFSDCTGVEGGVEQCRSSGPELTFDADIGFDGTDFTMESDRFLSMSISRDPSFLYLVTSVPDPSFIPDFTCVDTSTAPEVTMDFRVGSADIGSEGWVALSLSGQLVITATPSTDQCEVSTLTYTLVGEPVG